MTSCDTISIAYFLQTLLLPTIRVFSANGHYLNNRVFLSLNYRLIVTPRKFDVLKTNMLVLRTSNFQGLTIRPRENEGTERDIQGVGWDMSIPLKLFLVFGGNGSLFPQTSA